MKIQKKEENVFSTSALDLFCSAMGVFMLLCFIILPYYGKKDSAKAATETSVVTPGLTVAISWYLKDVKAQGENKETKQSEQVTYSEIRGAICDFDLVIYETLPVHNKTFLHDYLHIETHGDATKARLVADGECGGSEVWVQPSVQAGESCDIYAALFDEAGLSSYLRNHQIQSCKVALRVLVLSGNGETQKWELELPHTDVPKYMLSQGTQKAINEKKAGYALDKEPAAAAEVQQKRLPLLKATVGADYSITLQLLPNSQLKPLTSHK